MLKILTFLWISLWLVSLPALATERPYKHLNAKEVLSLANKGNDKAQFELGMRWYQKSNLPTGSDLSKSESESFGWLFKSAQTGNVDALHQLGLIYYAAKDSPQVSKKQNIALAYKSFEQAARRGQTDAMFKLGEMMHKGEGTLQKMDEGRSWIKRAADKGQPEAIAWIKLRTAPPTPVKPAPTRPVQSKPAPQQPIQTQTAPPRTVRAQPAPQPPVQGQLSQTRPAPTKSVQSQTLRPVAANPYKWGGLELSQNYKAQCFSSVRDATYSQFFNGNNKTCADNKNLLVLFCYKNGPTSANCNVDSTTARKSIYRTQLFEIKYPVRYGFLEVYDVSNCGPDTCGLKARISAYRDRAIQNKDPSKIFSVANTWKSSF